MTISLPLSRYWPDSPIGPVFATAATVDKGVCPGDSGSPVFRHQDDGAYILLGTVIGGVSACMGDTTDTPVAFSHIAMGYLSLLDPALASAGYPTIPGAPDGIHLQAFNRDVVVTWDAPAISPESVVTYQVLDGTGAVRCSTTTLTCTVPNVPDGDISFTVHAVNADGDGDALPVDSFNAVTIAGPPRMQAPTAQAASGRRIVVSISTLAGETSAVVASYTVKDTKGKVLCRVRPTSPTSDQLATMRCTTHALKPGSYRLTVTAETQMGTTPRSPASKAVVIH